MKILMTLMGLDIGGAETHVVELSKELSRRGHTVVLASNGGVYEAALAEAGICNVKIPLHLRSMGSMFQSLRLLKDLLREEKPDLVHAHARIPAFLCGILHKQMGFPFITSAHWVFEVTPLLKLLTDWGQRTVAVSEDIKTYLMQNYQVPADQIHVTINGVDTVQFAPGEGDKTLRQSLGLGDGPVIGTVSRLDKSRELAAKELIALMPRLSQQIPQAQLLVVGGGNEEENLRRQAADVNTLLGRQAVIMTGPSTDIARLVALSDVFVGVSRSALEAMAAEKPTILAGNEGYIGVFTPEVLPIAQETNFCCRGCPQIQGDKLLEDLCTLLNMDEARELGRFGRQVVLEQYSVARMTQDYLDAYQQLLSPVRPVRAAVSGYYGYGNLGDDAILLAISRQLSKTTCPVELTVLSRHPKETASEYGLRAVHRFSPFAVLKTLKNSDVLISGGGSLLQDKTSTRSLMYYTTVIRLAKWMKKPVFVYANGIGPLNHKANLKRVRKCMDACQVITLRDEDSLAELKTLGVTRDDIVITGDPAFALEPKAMSSGELEALGIPEVQGLIGISVRNVPGADHYSREFASLCDRLVREQGKTIVFLVMQEAEDLEISNRIRALMQAPSYLVKTPGCPETMLALIRRMDTLVAMRLHTIIFAAGVNVPVVGCVYDPKVASFLNMLDLPSCGTPGEMDADEAYRKTVELLECLPEQRKNLRERVAHLVPKAEQTGELFEKLMKEHNLPAEP